MAIRRRDFSAYLVHLTRQYEGASARENLMSILESNRIEARSPLGIAVARLKAHGCDTEEALHSQRTACFSETPLDDLSGLIDPGVWRECDFEPYGLVFDREYMLGRGANPVWYLNMYSGQGITFVWLSNHVNRLIADLVEELDPEEATAAFLASPLSKLTPYIDTMGRWRTPRGLKTKDFSFEREWRHVGDFVFGLEAVRAIITPPDDQKAFRDDLFERIPPERFNDLIWRPLEAEEVVAS